MQLILHELRRAPTLPFFAPLPRVAALTALCSAFVHQPHVHASPVDWAWQLHKSERNFTRFVRLQTGMSFGAWRQQAGLLAALSRLSRLARGDAVTTVALYLGCESPGAFSTMLCKRLGCPPSEFLPT